jgi:hypothetical protein
MKAAGRRPGPMTAPQARPDPVHSPKPGILPVLSRYGPALLLLALLAYPIARVAALHLTLTGACEEGLGYRYFYSLRLLYDLDGYVFLPQGHLMDLVHQLMQLVLTGAGLRPDSVFPRIDIFSYGSIAIAQLTAAAAFLLVSRPVPSPWARVAMAAVVLVPFYDVPISGFNVILEPDYMLWILPVMLVTAGAVFRLKTGGFVPWSQGDSWTLAALVTAALGLKATLLIYPITLGIVLLVRRKGFQASFVQAVTAVVLGVLGWLLVLLVYYHGRWDNVLRYFSDEARFGSSVRPAVAYLGWIRAEVGAGRWLVTSSILLPLAMLVVLATSRTRPRLAVACGVLAGSAIYHLFLFFRDTPVTWFEAGNYLVFSVLVVLYKPVFLAVSRAGRAALAVTAVVAGLSVFDGVKYMHKYYIPYLVTLNHAQEQAAAALAPFGDRIAFLLPDNSYRPLTIDSDVFKGGSNILEGARFGKSKLVRGLYPLRWYFTETPAYYAASPIDLGPYRAVVFVVRKGLDPGPEGQLALMRAHYGPALSGLKLLDDIDFGSQEFLVWGVAGPKG